MAKETKDQKAAREASENEVRGSRDAMRIQAKMRQMDRQKARKAKR